ncbi:MAG: hypothetical protein RIE08_07670 [Acidimicrobiales bacterium]
MAHTTNPEAESERSRWHEPMLRRLSIDATNAEDPVTDDPVTTFS